MRADLRSDPLFKEVHAYFRATVGPALGRIVDASDVHASADGASIAVVGPVLGQLSGKPTDRLGIVDATNGEVRMIGGDFDDSCARWSPAGERLAFLSDRAERGRQQLYLLDGAAGEPELRASTVTDPIETLAWAPGGQTLLLQTVGSGADRAGAQGSGTFVTATSDAPAWMPTVEEAVPAQAWRRLYRYDVASDSLTPVPTDGFTVWEAAWCGDDTILAVVSDDPREGGWYDARLVALHADGSVELLYRPEFEIGLPCASPDGRYAAIVAASCSDRIVVAGDVLLFDRQHPGAPPVRLDTLGVDVTCLGFRDGETLYFAGVREPRVVAGEIAIATRAAREVWNTDGTALRRYPAVAPLPSGEYVTVAHAYDRPPAVTALRAGSERIIRDFAHAGTAIVREGGGSCEPVSWQGRDGLEIRGFLVQPDGAGPHPLVVMVHGGPTWCFMNAWQMFYRLAPLLVRRGYAVLHPNPRGSSGRGQAFARMVRGDMNGEDTFDIIAGVESLIDAGVAERGRIAVTGGSYGGMMSSWIITQTDLFAASIPVSPVTDNFSQHFTSNIPEFDVLFLDSQPNDPNGKHFSRSAVFYAGRAKTPTLNITGGLDRCTPPTQAMEFHRALVQNGVPSELVVYPQEGHGVRDFDAAVDYCTRILMWLEMHVGAPRVAERADPVIA